MKFVLFYHSLLSDWNHGNAHFLRGIVGELKRRGHDVVVYEPEQGWSLSNLLEEHGEKPLKEFRRRYPDLESIFYRLDEIDLDEACAGADVVMVHEWNEPELVERIGKHRELLGDYLLFFHDTHHRMATAPEEMERYDLRHYDGVLAFGEVIRRLYAEKGIENAWTWHEAADTQIFQPEFQEKKGDLVWIGNWGDDERTEELMEFLIEPVRRLGLKARVYGVRYPKLALAYLEENGIEYGGWLPNYEAPRVFSQYRMTIHVPRRPYAKALPGIPTIRVFEALACGIPLLSAPWSDAERLFKPGLDFVMVRNGDEMAEAMERVLVNPEMAQLRAEHGMETIHQRHTCANRVDQLLEIIERSQTIKLSCHR